MEGGCGWPVGFGLLDLACYDVVFVILCLGLLELGASVYDGLELGEWVLCYRGGARLGGDEARCVGCCGGGFEGGFVGRVYVD